MQIPFYKPYMVGRELGYINQAQAHGKLAGDGPFTHKCNDWLEAYIGSPRALLTHSCTAALEMAAMLIDVQEGDEIIMPSYTFVSTANAFVLRGGIPVFVDLRPDTLNIDERKIEAAITPKTKAIVPVHYAGVGCEMNAIMELARKYDLYVIEDAAQGLMASYNSRPLGSFGHMAALSFHETKNIIAGEGGALLVNDQNLVDRAEIVREKGTNRCSFLRGEVNKYSWVGIGSSYLPSEMIAAFLFAQLEEAARITQIRLAIWERYRNALKVLGTDLGVQCMSIPENCQHNAHMYYLKFANSETQRLFIEHMKESGIGVVSHYVPLHSSLFGKRVGRYVGNMEHTIHAAECIARLPFWVGVDVHLDFVIDKILYFFGKASTKTRESVARPFVDQHTQEAL